MSDLLNSSNRLLAQKIILALDEYGRNVHPVEYGLPIDPDTKDFQDKRAMEMLSIVTDILDSDNKNKHILAYRERAVSWWNNLGSNPLLRKVYQGELTTKYYGHMRKSSSLTESQIGNIYFSEGGE